MQTENVTRKITAAGIIAALYTVLTMISAMLGLASGVVQIRISEALCILPVFTSAAVPGLAIGCFVANLVSGGVILDALFGSLATLSGALIAYLLGKCIKGKILRLALIPLPNVVANTVVIPWVLRLVYGESGAIWYFALTVGLGELAASYLLGIPLAMLLEKNKKQLFR